MRYHSSANQQMIFPFLHSTIISNCPGTINLSLDDSVTIEDLRGIKLDNNPPVLGVLPNYDKRQTDSFALGTAPYEARDTTKLILF